MSSDCCPTPEVLAKKAQDIRYRRVLWVSLFINGGMFIVEILSGLAAGSVALQADALDFLGDAANYGISLFVIGMAIRYRAMAALFKGVAMAAIAVWVIGSTGYNIINQTLPDAMTMGVVGIAAFIANATVFLLLWAYRHGDSNMRSVWICTRNDVVGNLAVVLASIGVFGTGTGWPDIIVASIMAFLGIQGAWVICRQAYAEIKSVS